LDIGCDPSRLIPGQEIGGLPASRLLLEIAGFVVFLDSRAAESDECISPVSGTSLLRPCDMKRNNAQDQFPVGVSEVLPDRISSVLDCRSTKLRVIVWGCRNERRHGHQASRQRLCSSASLPIASPPMTTGSKSICRMRLAAISIACGSSPAIGTAMPPAMVRRKLRRSFSTLNVSSWSGLQRQSTCC
jgi:hypothetical protein